MNLFAVISPVIFLGIYPSLVGATDERLDLCPVGRKDKKQIRYMVKPEGKLFAETSYIAFSSQTYDDHPVLWMGSDRAQYSISAVDLVTGKLIQTYDLAVSDSDDWESISLGPCTSKKKTAVCLYIGDTGDNEARECTNNKCKEGRDEVRVYKLEEPDVNDDKKVRSPLEVVTMRLKYDGRSLPTNQADSEAMFVDNSGDGGKPGDLYLVTKFPFDVELQRLVKVPVKEHEDLDAGEEMEYSLSSEGQPYGDRVWTGADMSSDGSIIALRSYRRIIFYPRMASQSVAEALENPPCSYASVTDKSGKHEQQFEAVTMVGQDVAEASECSEKAECTVAITVHKLKYKNGDDCHDDVNWFRATKRNKTRRCDWVAKDADERCSKLGEDGRKARKACRFTCGKCG